MSSTDLNGDYHEGFEEGLKVGKTEGYEEGYAVGFDEGVEEGRSKGYDEGYNEGRDVGNAEGYREAEEEYEYDDDEYGEGVSDGKDEVRKEFNKDIDRLILCYENLSYSKHVSDEEKMMYQDFIIDLKELKDA